MMQTETARERLSSIATHHSKPQHAGVSKFWDHVNGGELSAVEVRRARRLEVEYLNKMKVVERVPCSFIKHRTGKEHIKVTWVDTLKTSGIDRSNLLAKEFRRGSKIDGFMNISATPPLELVKLMRSMVAPAQRDQTEWFGQEGHESSSEIVMMHTDISRAYFHAPCKEEKCVELPPEMWSKGCPECGRLRVSLCGTRDAPANREDAYCGNTSSTVGVSCPCSFYSRVKGVRIIVHRDDFISGGPRHQLKWLEEVVDEHFETKHTVMGASSDLAKSLVMLNRKILWQDNGIAYIPDK